MKNVVLRFRFAVIPGGWLSWFSCEIYIFFEFARLLGSDLRELIVLHLQV